MSETRERELVERLRNYHTGASWAAKPNAVMQSLAEAADLIEALSASTQVDAMREALEEAREAIGIYGYANVRGRRVRQNWAKEAIAKIDVTLSK